MKKQTMLPLALALMVGTLWCVTGLAAGGEGKTPATEARPDLQTNPAGIGAWTTDYPDALKVAAERQLPLFIQFTGSDWCGWCQLMEKQCFSKPEFLQAMRTQCVLVSVDFPHKTKLPEALQAQNKALAEQFKKRAGFPAYYLVDSDGKTIRWSFGADPKYGKDLDLLISDIQQFCSGCDGVVARTAKGLPAAKANAYRDAARAFAARQQTVAAWLNQDHADGKAAKEEFKAYLAELLVLADQRNEFLKP